jgi:ATP-binding cassette subfamily B protein
MPWIAEQPVLRMIAKYYGRLYTAQTLRQRSSITREGVSLLGISDAAESIGMRTMGVKTTLENLEKEESYPIYRTLEPKPFCCCL